MLLSLQVHCGIPNKQGYVRPVLYGVLGCSSLVFVLKSGVHATIAGVVLAMTIPATGKLDGETVYPMLMNGLIN